jgi:signal transduction histidine kinase
MTLMIDASNYHPIDAAQKPVGVKRFFIRYRRWVTGLLGLLVIALELHEHLDYGQFNLSYFIEFALFLILLISLALLLEHLAKNGEQIAETAKLIELKHQISLRLTSAEDWNELVELITRLPFTFAFPERTLLLLYDRELGEFEIAGEYPRREQRADPLEAYLPPNDCVTCPERGNRLIHPLSACQLYQPDLQENTLNGSCFPLAVGSEMEGVLHVFMPPGGSLTADQIEFMNNVRDEISVVLKAARQQRQISELETAEAAVFERQKVFRDLHDILGQNLGYLHLKLDRLAQISAVQNQPFASDLVKLRDVANESYAMVRETLGAIRSSTSPFLSSLLNHQSRLVAAQGNFEYKFLETGQPRPLSPLVLHNTYFICKEAINNIARHSAATCVEGRLDWGTDDLTITITDNGRGFDENKVDEQHHFGINIMRERIAVIHGRFDIHSSLGEGTQVTIWLPTR